MNLRDPWILIGFAEAAVRSQITQLHVTTPRDECHVESCEWRLGMSMAEVVSCLSLIEHRGCVVYLQFEVSGLFDLRRNPCVANAANKSSTEQVMAAHASLDFQQLLALDALNYWSAFSAASALNIVGGTLTLTLSFPVPGLCPVALEYVSSFCGASDPAHETDSLLDFVQTGDTRVVFAAGDLSPSGVYLSATFMDAPNCNAAGNYFVLAELDTVVLEGFLGDPKLGPSEPPFETSTEGSDISASAPALTSPFQPCLGLVVAYLASLLFHSMS
eukprot:Gregarina_sp_Pseudo_9__822@NODE_1526_length_1523_cov_323_811321_g1414_i0_p1_GENE_NODE_1526_length_1523_cov_323_811321_g1414_i0NODE_1526_length_1523_cov_323_811321_g1414_i0_p1_ORF_typecomplete_len274_score62_09_NODE_1526_length_1523_cov_323_811321_g1414_i02711092